MRRVCCTSRTNFAAVIIVAEVEAICCIQFLGFVLLKSIRTWVYARIQGHCGTTQKLCHISRQRDISSRTRQQVTHEVAHLTIWTRRISHSHIGLATMRNIKATSIRFVFGKRLPHDCDRRTMGFTKLRAVVCTVVALEAKGKAHRRQHKTIWCWFGKRKVTRQMNRMILEVERMASL